MKLVVLGGGESGVGAALLGRHLGYEVFLSDKGKLAESYRDELITHRIAFEEGQHSMDRIFAAELVVKSPGIPDTVPMVVALRERGIEVISEIEFAGRHTEAKMVCITGSNGKTTTTLLTCHILTTAGIDAGLAGNVGRSLAAQVAEDAHPLYVVELSSFQLDGMFDFRADIAVLTNITPDHLDRYDHKFENYIDSKFRILNNMRPQDLFIYGLDSEAVGHRLRQVRVVPRMAGLFMLTGVYGRKIHVEAVPGWKEKRWSCSWKTGSSGSPNRRSVFRGDTMSIMRWLRFWLVCRSVFRTKKSLKDCGPSRRWNIGSKPYGLWRG